MWKFSIDKGGTFTDIVAVTPQNKVISYKLLSDTSLHDPCIQGIESLIGVPISQVAKTQAIESLRLGTTLVTNQILEEGGDAVAFLTTRGFKDSLKIAKQTRPSIFELNVKPYPVFYDKSFEVSERIDARGEVICPLDHDEIMETLSDIYQQGYRILSICLINSYLNETHEREIKTLANEFAFDHVSISSDISKRDAFIPRGSTTAINAKATPIIQSYVSNLKKHFPNCPLLLMQSNGGLIEATHAQGKDMILSGPAGGVIGAKEVAKQEGIDKLISFDMGGTSTDISIVNGDETYTYEKRVSNAWVQSPMVDIETIASGGGSIVSIQGARLCVGPSSAGANPGPACYRKGGPLTLTDCQVALGRIIPKYFPKVFGDSGNLSIDVEAVRRELEELCQEVLSTCHKRLSPVQLADGALDIAIDKMAHAIRKKFLENGGHIEEYTLVAYGSASGQYICRLASQLGMSKICIPKMAGVLSAYGISLSPIKKTKSVTFRSSLDESSQSKWVFIWKEMQEELQNLLQSELNHLDEEKVQFHNFLHLKYKNASHSIKLEAKSLKELKASFEMKYHSLFGHLKSSEEIVVDALSVELIYQTEVSYEREYPQYTKELEDGFLEEIPQWHQVIWKNIPIYDQMSLKHGIEKTGPCILVSDKQTLVLEEGWKISLSSQGNFILEKMKVEESPSFLYEWNPIQLERFHVLFQSIAKQMGAVLQKVALSINIKERNDFSCALFDMKGRLIANAPHIPVHLGSMGQSVREVIEAFDETIEEGDVFMINSPFKGGTHLPDITVVMPVFYAELPHPFAFVAARGHHTDVGGLAPGSMSAKSHEISQEGVIIEATRIMKKELLDEKTIQEAFLKQKYPPRNIEQNISDLLSQVAACHEGKEKLIEAAEFYGGGVIAQYMEYILINGAQEVENLVHNLKESTFSLRMDQGHQIEVKIIPRKEEKRLTIDFTGTSPQSNDNFNAPLPICKAAILYVLRTMIPREIPLNEGCLWPVDIIVPEGSLINPKSPAAVAAGNVETSQAIVNALLGALGIQAASQGTMNNLSIGNDSFQYYETICGGCGAGKDYDGASAVHSHMTNSSITDPEILEKNMPLRLQTFAIRQGSGGKGLHDGGDGSIRKIVFLEDMEINILSNNRMVAPFGLQGGEAGKKGKQYICHVDGKIKELSSCCSVNVSKGDMLVIETPGGGAYGTKDQS